MPHGRAHTTLGPLSVLVVIAVSFCFATRVLAWGDLGHQIICQIAYLELKPEIKARVDALIAIDPKFRTFADACTAPDKFPRLRPPEHYLDRCAAKYAGSPFLRPRPAGHISRS